MDEARGTLSVPRELLDEIVSYLPNRDKKSLRQASSFFAETVTIRISRVFLSPIPRNIEVIEAIAAHPIRRHHVEQLIWDDSLLTTPAHPGKLRVTSDYSGSNGITYRGPNPALIREQQRLLQQGLGNLNEFQNLYTEACAVNIRDIHARRGNDCNTSAHLERQERVKNAMPILQSVLHYMELVKQQEEVISTSQDIRAFRIALDRFPNLRKITITSVCHGFLFAPLYETPMIRSFPKGFNYPIPRAWPSYLGRDGYCTGSHCNATRWPAFHRASKLSWNGVRVVLKELALQDNRVTELEFNVHGLDQGVPVDIFDPTNEEARYLTSVVENLSRLTLSVEVPPSRTGNPIEERSHLIHKALARNPRFKVSIVDLVDFLSSMPSTLHSLELGMLRFHTFGETYYELMHAMRNKLGWRERSEKSRPKIVIRVDLQEPVRGRYITADKEVEEFMYGDGPNPFSPPTEAGYEFIYWCNQLCGKGIVHDEFDPAFERPNLSDEELVALGIIKNTRHIENLAYNIDDESEGGELEDDVDYFDYDSEGSSGEEDDEYEGSGSASE